MQGPSQSPNFDPSEYPPVDEWSRELQRISFTWTEPHLSLRRGRTDVASEAEYSRIVQDVAQLLKAAGDLPKEYERCRHILNRTTESGSTLREVLVEGMQYSLAVAVFSAAVDDRCDALEERYRNSTLGALENEYAAFERVLEHFEKMAPKKIPGDVRVNAWDELRRLSHASEVVLQSMSRDAARLMQDFRDVIEETGTRLAHVDPSIPSGVLHLFGRHLEKYGRNEYHSSLVGVVYRVRDELREHQTSLSKRIAKLLS
jgi:hypothetical protein